MGVCSVFGCTSNPNPKLDQFDPSISFFRFPKDVSLQEQWVKVTLRNDNFVIKNARICSLHFTQTDFIVKTDCRGVEKRFLKPGAVPSANIESLISIPTAKVSHDFIGPNISIENSIKSFGKFHISTQTDSYLAKLERELAYSKKKCAKLQKALQDQNKIQVDLEFNLSKIFSFRQLDKLKYPKKQIRYTTCDIESSISYYNAGPRLYRLLRKRGFPFPSRSTLHNWAQNVDIQPGICETVVSILKEIPLNKTEKVCVLSFDEMKVSEANEYDRKLDETIKPSKYVQVAMIRGLFNNWKQPIFFDFDSNFTIDLLTKIILTLEGIGFSVVAVVCDLGSGNRALWKKLGISEETPYFANPSNSQNRIFVFSDPPHLIKLIRNNYIDHGFNLNGAVLNITPIRETLRLSKTADLSINHKISTTHLDVKKAGRQKVKLATQLFSHTVHSSINWCASHGYLADCSNWAAVAQFIKQTNDWFDCLNIRIPQTDSRPHKKAFGLALNEQTAIIKTFSDVIRNIRVGQHKYLMPFQKGILVTNAAVIGLLDETKKRFSGIHFILTYRLNQDVLENFFGQIRGCGGLHDHPKRLEFQHRFKRHLLGRNDHIISSSQNCIDDFTHTLSSTTGVTIMPLSSRNVNTNEECMDVSTLPIPAASSSASKSSYLFNSQPLSSNSPSDISESKVPFLNDAEISEFEHDGLEHMAGAMLHKLNSKYDITGLGFYAATSEDKSFSWVNHLSEGGLIKPTQHFMQCVERMESIFNAINNKHLYYCKGFLAKHLEMSEDIQLPLYAKQLFFRSRMYFRIRYLNKQLINYKAN